MSSSSKDLIKKRRERFVLDRFCETTQRMLRVVEEREEPDFVVADGNREMGLELAEVFKGRRLQKPDGVLHSPGKAVESKRLKDLRRLATEYYKRGGRPLHVQALLPDGFYFDVNTIVDLLIAARPAVPGDRGGISFSPDASFRLLALPDDMKQQSDWVPVNNSVGWRRQDQLEDLQAVVREKATHLDNYRLARPRISLLLHADGTRSSGMISWADDFGPVDSCGFDEVHLYIHPGQAWRLG